MQPNNLGSYKISINNEEFVELHDFVKGSILPEVIQSLKVDFNAENGISIMAILGLLDVLVSKVKNKTEYTLIAEALIGCTLAVKKLEYDTGLGDDRY